MRFLIAQATRKNHISELADCADYCITAEGTLIMRCPVDGTLAYLDKRNVVASPDPLTISGPFKFPCPSGVFHAFTVQDGKLQSSKYADKRYPIEGFDFARTSKSLSLSSPKDTGESKESGGQS